jgi:hypothetical protein
MGHPGEMVFKFHWAPIAGSSFHYDRQIYTDPPASRCEALRAGEHRLLFSFRKDLLDYLFFQKKGKKVDPSSRETQFSGEQWFTVPGCVYLY